MSGRDDRGKQGRGAWRSKKDWRKEESAASNDKPANKVAEPFMLPGSPSTTKVYEWMDALYNWAAQHVCRWGWHKILDRHKPGNKPEAVEPDEPDPDDFEYDYQFQNAQKVYWDRMRRFDEAKREIRQDGVFLFLRMKINLSPEAKRDLEDRHEQEAYKDEDAVKLRDAVLETMLGKPTGHLGNPLDIARQRKQFMAINQRSFQTVQSFYEFYKQGFEALIQAETSGDRTREQVMEQDWPEATRVEHFLACLNERSVGDYLDDIRFNSDVAMPATVEDAFKEACLAAKKQGEKMKRNHQSQERMGTYATNVRDGRGRNERRDNRDSRSNRDRSIGRDRSPAKIVLDVNGDRCCFNYLKGRCTYKNCQYSHKQPVSHQQPSVSSGKGPAVDQDVVNAIAKLHSKGTTAVRLTTPGDN